MISPRVDQDDEAASPVGQIIAQFFNFMREKRALRRGEDDEIGFLGYRLYLSEVEDVEVKVSIAQFLD